VVGSDKIEFEFEFVVNEMHAKASGRLDMADPSSWLKISNPKSLIIK
jgi:hypothetical protein